MTTTRDELRRLAENATPGPWEAGVDDLTGDINVHHDLEVRMFVAWTGMTPAPYSREDAEFIAAARTALPALLDQLDAAETRIAAVDAELLYAELHGNDEVWTHNIRRALDGEG